jgi:phage baseplate assembly protein W
MVQAREIWGKDLRLLPNLEQQNDRDRGYDLSTTTRDNPGQIDLETLSDVDNLKQALLLRFLTPRGELTLLGHANYGSRLYELIGELNNESNRNRAKLFVLQTLGEEPRVKEIRSVSVTSQRGTPDRIDIDIWLLATDSETPINLVFPFFLGGGSS